jgi:hypothetical protein
LTVSEDDGTWTAKSVYKAKPNVTFSAFAGIDNSIAGDTSASIKAAFPVLDIAMCVDSTGSMTPTLDAVKNNATTFYDRLAAELTARGVKPFSHVRVRLSYFKDFGDATPGVWDADPLVSSDFFDLPDERDDFADFASPQMASGGGDWAESGIVCLNEAIHSDWMEVGDSIPGHGSDKVTEVFPLIIVWTDAPSRDINFRNSLANPDYPRASEMPRAYPAMLAKWNNRRVVDQTNKQILFFGDPNLNDTASGEDSAWLTIKNWPGFRVGGSLLDANSSMVEFIAEGIASAAKELAVTH